MRWSTRVGMIRRRGFGSSFLFLFHMRRDGVLFVVCLSFSPSALPSTCELQSNAVFAPPFASRLFSRGLRGPCALPPSRRSSSHTALRMLCLITTRTGAQEVTPSPPLPLPPPRNLPPQPTPPPSPSTMTSSPDDTPRDAVRAAGQTRHRLYVPSHLFPPCFRWLTFSSSRSAIPPPILSPPATAATTTDDANDDITVVRRDGRPASSALEWRFLEFASLSLSSTLTTRRRARLRRAVAPAGSPQLRRSQRQGAV